MNDRINELRLDAGISRLHDEPYLVAVNKSGEIEDPMIGLEKFAELIVRECAKIIEAQDVDPSFKNRLSWAMKDKFGVEE